jgi:hypothetical protein
MLFFLKSSCKKLNRILYSGLKGTSGQVVSEYAIMIIMCMLLALAVMVFSHYFSVNGWRMITQVGVGYP